MVLPLFLAMNASEITASPIPQHCAWMACHFSAWGEGISNFPASLPAGSILILNDRIPCRGHSADLVASQISEAVSRFECESVLLDFQRPDNPETELVVQSILSAATYPVCITEYYGRNLSCPILLGPCPLHIPIEEYLVPWKDREIWLEAALCQQAITITKDGTDFASCIPSERYENVFFDETLCCQYFTQIEEKQIRFTLFDTMASLEKKLENARKLGVNRAIGLWQELGGFQPGK